MSSKNSDGLQPLDIFADLPPIVSLDVIFPKTYEIEYRIPSHYKLPQEGIDFSQVDLKEHLLGALPTIKLDEKNFNNPREFLTRMKNIPKYTKKDIPKYTKKERKGIIERYFEKKKRRNKQRNKQKIRYLCRQRFANKRPRVGGRFCSEPEINIINLFPDLKNKADKGISISKKEFEKAKELYLSKKK